MSIATTRIDGQTLGFDVTAPSIAVDVLSLNMATGVVTSSYLTAADITNLAATVDGIFSVVPYASRGAGALNILTKLVSGASVDSSTVTPSAVPVGGDLYTLRLTPSAVPASMIAGLPYSATGISAFAMSGAVTGGGGGGVNTVTATAPIASSGGANPNITHNVSGVVAAAYTNASITVDDKGHVTLAASGTAPVTGVTATAPITSTGGATPDIGLSPISDVNVAVGAAIQRNKLASGTAGAAVVNDGTGVMSEVAPGTAGNILTDTGVAWVSAPPPAATLQYWAEAQSVFVRTIDSFTAVAVAPDADAVLSPKGMGSVSRDAADGAGGGNARGLYAVDWGSGRTAADQVASGTGSVVSGGFRNKATNNYSTVSGGFQNSSGGQSSVICGGDSNTVASNESMIGAGAGNTIFGGGSDVIGGGTLNQINGMGYNSLLGGRLNLLDTAAEHSVICGGQQNHVSSSKSVLGGGAFNVISAQGGVLGGGDTNKVQAYRAAILGGGDNQANEAYAAVLGGRNNVADGAYSVVIGGARGTTRGTTGRSVFSSGYTPFLGANQTSMVVLWGDTIGAVPSPLTVDGANPVNANNTLLMPDTSAFKIRAEVIARLSTAPADVRGWTIEGIAYRDVGVASTAVTGVTVTTFGAGLVGASVSLVADNAVGGGIYVEATGIAFATIRWTATLYSSEAAW